ncbi:MAG: AraC family transcriptional regulator [Chitinophagales bacterium]|nr:AraC family transcriptional regulator [Chitinophagales bacterium]
MKQQIIFLIQPHTNLLDLGSATQSCLEAIDMGLEAELVFCTYGSEITSSVGLPFGKLLNFASVKPKSGDIIFIVSTDISFILSSRYKISDDLSIWLNKAYTSDCKICAICNGAFLLGKVGLLDGKNCTTHWKRTQELQMMFPLAKVVENIIFIEDENIVTSAGGVSGIDVTLYMLSKIKDEYFSHKIARELVMHQRRNGGESQQSIYTEKRNHVHSGIHKVQDFIIQNIHKKLSVAELAEHANMSYRNFFRIFKNETELSPIDYINMVRREKALQFSKDPDLSLKQIANLVGLSSERHLQRILK